MHKNYLENENLKIKIMQMEESNQRFDHLGCVFQVKNKKNGEIYLSQEEMPESFRNRGIGICDEFCASNPVGFAHAAYGEWFLKPGCGLLKKRTKHYSFRDIHELLPVEVKAISTEAFQEFQCECQYRSYAYHYKKRYSLEGRELKVEYELKNTGKSPIIWQTYAHNFFLPQAMDICGMRLRCENIPLKAMKLLEGEEILEFKGKEGSVIKQPEKGTLYVAEMLPDLPKGYRYVLLNAFNEEKIWESGDFIPIKFKIWLDKNCFCPEIFGEFSAYEGETVYWSRTYEFV